MKYHIPRLKHKRGIGLSGRADFHCGPSFKVTPDIQEMFRGVSWHAQEDMLDEKLEDACVGQNVKFRKCLIYFYFFNNKTSHQDNVTLTTCNVFKVNTTLNLVTLLRFGSINFSSFHCNV